MTTTPKKTVLVSILNWNTAPITIACVDTLLKQILPSTVKMEILIIDNGSKPADAAALSSAAKSRNVEVMWQKRNLGFAAGHNLAIVCAKERKFDFIWLMNSDALVDQHDVLHRLVITMDKSPQCGAVSPLLVILEDSEKIYFSGFFHDWASRVTVKADNIEESRRLQAAIPENLWLPGTAILLRMEALDRVGNLDERLFAYFEDDDMGARLAEAGWISLVDYDARVRHAMPGAETDRPPYYFYLMARNFLIFWHGRTPVRYRSMLWLRLLDTAMFDVNRLRYRGHYAHAAAALLGVHDFLTSRYGAPQLERDAGLLVRCLQKILWPYHLRALKRLGAAPTRRKSKIEERDSA